MAPRRHRAAKPTPSTFRRCVRARPRTSPQSAARDAALGQAARSPRPCRRRRWRGRRLLLLGRIAGRCSALRRCLGSAVQAHSPHAKHRFAALRARAEPAGPALVAMQALPIRGLLRRACRQHRRMAGAANAARHSALVARRRRPDGALNKHQKSDSSRSRRQSTLFTGSYPSAVRAP